jgi:predicted DNA-binding antitoxin AbrB/MazE fold protein
VIPWGTKVFILHVRGCFVEVEVVFEGGVFKPLSKVNLPEGTRGKVIIRAKLSERLRNYVGLLRQVNDEEAYHDYILERTSVH